MKGQTYVITTILFVIIIAVFAVVNVVPVEVNYIFWSGQSPLILVILFSVLMGGLISGAAGTVRFMKLRREHKQLVNENTNLRQLLNEHGIEAATEDQITGNE